jgi:hypothetical protein
MLSRCLAVLPNAGLGNILFPWASAQVFASLNGIPATAIGWSRPHIGPLLRGETQLRVYRGSFQSSYRDIVASVALMMVGNVVRNAVLEKVPCRFQKGHLFFWSGIPAWHDYFGALKPFRSLIRRRMWDALNPDLRQRAMENRPPVVAVHIRCGDFRRLDKGEDFRNVGGVRTPLEYFVNRINEIRGCYGSCLPVTVFTDGRYEDVVDVLALPGVQLAERDMPIVDLLLMSRAQILVVSASSTFSYWAGFLGDCAVLLHPDHVHAPHRPPWINEVYYEGPAEGPHKVWPDLLVQNIRAVREQLADPKDVD